MYARDEARIATPIGTVRLLGGEERLDSIQICDGGNVSRGTALMVSRAAEQLQQWFAGERAIFDLMLAPAATPRGEALRAALCAIPYGDTASYGVVARAAGSAARAIGQACARNPFPIVVPCHRVTAASGLGHYSAGSGLATKRWLIDFEREHSGEHSR